MPYIKQRERDILATIQPANAAQLCYVLCELVAAPINNVQEAYRAVFDGYIAGFPKEEVSWKTYAEVMGAILGTVSELGRRKLNYDRQPLMDAFAKWYYEVVGPYEDAKITENGDVFP
jgi:hypothetical protein